MRTAPSPPAITRMKRDCASGTTTGGSCTTTTNWAVLVTPAYVAVAVTVATPSPTVVIAPLSPTLTTAGRQVHALALGDVAVELVVAHRHRRPRQDGGARRVDHPVVDVGVGSGHVL